jgi:hypothetical protein
LDTCISDFSLSASFRKFIKSLVVDSIGVSQNFFVTQQMQMVFAGSGDKFMLRANSNGLLTVINLFHKNISLKHQNQIVHIENQQADIQNHQIDAPCLPAKCRCDNRTQAEQGGYIHSAHTQNRAQQVDKCGKVGYFKLRRAIQFKEVSNFFHLSFLLSLGTIILYHS